MGIKCPKCQSNNPDTQQYCGECGTHLIASREIPVTETLETPTEELTRGATFAGRYEIIEELGKGGGKEFIKRIENLFNEVIKRYSDVFGITVKIYLKPVTIGFVISQLQKYSLTNTPADVKETAFQTFVYAHQRGDRGEFFTPKLILDLVVEFLNPKEHEDLIDPACGSGGFLVSTMNYIREKIRRERPDLEKKDIAMNLKL